MSGQPSERGEGVEMPHQWVRDGLAARPEALSREVLTQVLLAHYPVSMSYCRCSYEGDPMVWWTPDHVADVLGFPPVSDGAA